MLNPYLTYIEKAVEPKNKLMDEYYFYQELAKKLGIDNYPYVSKKEYLEQVIVPLKANYGNISLEYIKDTYLTIRNPVAWNDKKFETSTGKYEVFVEKNAKENIHKDKGENSGLRLLTNHGKDSLFSQHYMDEEKVARAYINSQMAKKYKLGHRDLVFMESSEGRIKVRLKIDDSISDDVVDRKSVV